MNGFDVVVDIQPNLYPLCATTLGLKEARACCRVGAMDGDVKRSNSPYCVANMGACVL